MAPAGQEGADFASAATGSTEEWVQLRRRIAATPGVDVMFIGPGDLGLRLKHYPETEFNMEQAIQRVAEAARKHGKNWGQPAGSMEVLKKLYSQGARFLNHGGEYIAIMRMLEECALTFDEVYGGRNPPPAS